MMLRYKCALGAVPLALLLSGCAEGPRKSLSDSALEANSAGMELAIAGLRKNCYPEQSVSILELEARMKATEHGYAGGRISQLPISQSDYGSESGGGEGSC